MMFSGLGGNWGRTILGETFLGWWKRQALTFPSPVKGSRFLSVKTLHWSEGRLWNEQVGCGDSVPSTQFAMSLKLL